MTPRGHDDLSLAWWRDRILLVLYFFGVVAGAFVYIPSIAYLVISGHWTLASLNLVVYGAFCFVFLYGRLSYNFRAWLTNSLMFLLGVMVLGYQGPYSAGFLWLFLFPIITGALLGWRPAMAALALNALAMAVLGLMAYWNLFAWSHILAGDFTLWFFISFTFIFVESVSVMSVVTLIEAVDKNNRRLQSALEELRTEVERRRQAEERIKESLAEKEVLLREVHHRVKNNMQVLKSLLNLQARKEKNPQALGAIHEARARINAMAQVHESLYSGAAFTAINLKQYIQHLIRSLGDTYHTPKKNVEFRLDIEADLSVSIDMAVPCGLVLNELITNSIKYAYPDDSTGQVRVRARRLKVPEEVLEMLISDDGVGFPGDAAQTPPKTLGLELVRSLVEIQLRGKLERLPGAGASWRVTFPLTEAYTRPPVVPSPGIGTGS